MSGCFSPKQSTHRLQWRQFIIKSLPTEILSAPLHLHINCLSDTCFPISTVPPPQFAGHPPQHNAGQAVSGRGDNSDGIIIIRAHHLATGPAQAAATGARL